MKTRLDKTIWDFFKNECLSDVSFKLPLNKSDLAWIEIEVKVKQGRE